MIRTGQRPPPAGDARAALLRQVLAHRKHGRRREKTPPRARRRAHSGAAHGTAARLRRRRSASARDGTRARPHGSGQHVGRAGAGGPGQARAPLPGVAASAPTTSGTPWPATRAPAAARSRSSRAYAPVHLLYDVGRGVVVTPANGHRGRVGCLDWRGPPRERVAGSGRGLSRRVIQRLNACESRRWRSGRATPVGDPRRRRDRAAAAARSHHCGAALVAGRRLAGDGGAAPSAVCAPA